jgi:hypothetical protein
MHRVVTKKGLNVAHHQSHEIPHMRNETLLIPSTSQPQFGSYFIFDLKEKGCILHDIGIEFTTGPITGQNPNIATSTPRYNPAIFWFSRIEVVINSQVIDTIYPLQQFVHQQLFNDDVKRRLINHSMGAYDSVQQRFYKSHKTSKYHVNLSTLFNQAHIPLMFQKDDIQLRVYLETKDTIIVKDSTQTSPVITGSLTANLIARVSKLHTPHIQSIAKAHVRPNHYKFLETRFGTFNVTSSSINTSIVLTPIVGTVSYFFFVVRSVNNLPGDGAFTFLPIHSWALLDAASTNIVGGQVITSDYSLRYLNKDWSQSTYTTEIAYDSEVVSVAGLSADLQTILTAAQNTGSKNTNAYVYFYSFSADPNESTKTGNGYNHHKFVGNEQLQITFSMPPSSSVQIDLYAAVESVLESSQTYSKKISL